MTTMTSERVRITTRVPARVQNTLEIAAAMLGATVEHVSATRQG
uniref:Uncharacterized protein n=1 Tax=Candidatus Kentrum sp. TUN TaxID=2126343 RepID=A0A451APJ9_9GAMM|nr:MAG: hypothetical protein BECKTUN1418F_GA0071002_11773 [Candidatus Kentron sp. TUN]VFK59707.1 MAG: hypothetical protein BECKTUN1418D_GA0071000_11073 [Candidatus Kentron sp. TUN]VFK67981.1 MAG: hypothetical protein BECKTUN1418E_GA0071001_11723 [Candidatus Kentron sp. TUN]